MLMRSTRRSCVLIAVALIVQAATAGGAGAADPHFPKPGAEDALVECTDIGDSGWYGNGTECKYGEMAVELSCQDADCSGRKVLAIVYTRGGTATGQCAEAQGISTGNTVRDWHVANVHAYHYYYASPGSTAVTWENDQGPGPTHSNCSVEQGTETWGYFRDLEIGSTTTIKVDIEGTSVQAGHDVPNSILMKWTINLPADAKTAGDAIERITHLRP
jgi:hypothetical protein